jgi:hypothetical protein
MGRLKNIRRQLPVAVWHEAQRALLPPAQLRITVAGVQDGQRRRAEVIKSAAVLARNR